MTTSQPFSNVTVCPPGIWIASTSRVSSVRSMPQILDPAARPRQRSFDSDRQPPPRHHVAHGEPDQDGEPEEAATRYHPDDPRALAQGHEQEADEDRTGERDARRDHHPPRL